MIISSISQYFIPAQMVKFSTFSSTKEHKRDFTGITQLLSLQNNYIFPFTISFMSARIIKRCRNPYCKQPFGITQFTKLVEDNRAKCPFCGFLNKLGSVQRKKVMALHR